MIQRRVGLWVCLPFLTARGAGEAPEFLRAEVARRAARENKMRDPSSWSMIAALFQL